MRADAVVVALGLLAAGVVAGPDAAAGDRAICGWVAGFHIPDANGPVLATASFDDGGGPDVYVGGSFTRVGSAWAASVARWDGQRWSALCGPSGCGVDGYVYALAAYDDGSGPALYVAGDFDTAGGVAAGNIARWDGSRWSAVGPPGTGTSHQVLALATWNDGTGEALYAAGVFGTAGGVPASGIARWNGSQWSALVGPSGNGVDSQVSALAVYDDGSGPALFAGGWFDLAGGVAAPHLAKWNGSAWSALAGGSVNDAVAALAVFNDGSGPALYAGGRFDHAGETWAIGIARWNGTSWSHVWGGVDGTVAALTVLDGPGGSALYAGGQFVSAGGVPAENIARWDGTAWSPLGSGVSGNYGSYSGVLALLALDSPGEPLLLVGGAIDRAGELGVGYVAGWTGVDWQSIGAGGNGARGNVACLLAVDETAGEALYAGGYFTSVGNLPANGIARFDGSSWSALGSGVTGFDGVVHALALFDDGGGPALYAGGYFDRAGEVDAWGIARWDGSAWTDVGGGLVDVGGYPGRVYALAVYDDGAGPALYAGGNFVSAGGVPAAYLARWDGVSWSAVGDPLTYPADAFAVYDGGSGPALFIGNDLGVMRWDGASWTVIGSCTGGVLALAAYDDGAGPALYAGGGFSTIGGVSANRIAKWDGATWTPLGSGVSGWVSALRAYDDAGGPRLYVGGQFTQAGDVTAYSIARWNGSAWSAFGGVDLGVTALEVFRHTLMVGGSFSKAGGIPADNIARWSCEQPLFFCGFETGDTRAWSLTVP